MRYGLIGNCKTAALIHESGRLEWCCLPNFDSPSAFASILDPLGGHFEISPEKQGTIHQSYISQTNILQTEFDDGENAFVILDFMPRYREADSYHYPLEIHRYLKPLRGKPKIKVSFDPRLNYAEGKTHLECSENGIRARHEFEEVFLYSSYEAQKVLEGFILPLEKEEFFLLTYHEKMQQPSLEYTQEMYAKTKKYWETWSAACHLPKLAPDAVLRSALALKLMTVEETGAIVAAPTTSLPEALRESRNWDYRYCWLRDSSLTLEALKRVGQYKEAQAFIKFLLKILESKKNKIQIMYGIDGRTHLEEKILVHLKGYKGSAPVRVGNAAALMKQNDIYGEVLDCLYLYYFHYKLEKMSDEVWSLVKFLVNIISKEWTTADAGIWEYRYREAHFTFSKVLSWVALDRGSLIAEKMDRPELALQWRNIADEIKDDVHLKAWNPHLNSYTQTYGSSDFDVSVLRMCRYGFIEKDDPRWISTVQQCEKALLNNGFGFRYTSPDDFGKPKSSFILATFWIIKALHSIGEKEKALSLFNQTLAYANHLGLFSEDVNPLNLELLGNFPQAFSHMALINTAYLWSQDLEEPS